MPPATSRSGCSRLCCPLLPSSTSQPGTPRGYVLLDDSIRRFLQSYSAGGFPYAAEVLVLLRDYPRNDVRIETSVGALTDRVRTTYRVRAEIAARVQSPVLPHLRVDLASLAKSFEDAKDQPLRVWRLYRKEARVYLVVELVEDARIAGCLDTIDKLELELDR